MPACTITSERLDKGCEKGIWLLVLAILVFGPLATGAVRIPDFLVIQGLAAAATALWIVRLWVQRTPRLLWTPVCWVVFCFVAYAVARCRLAPIAILAQRELVRVLVYALLFVVILNNLHRQEATQWVVMALVFLAAAISLYAVYQFLTGSGRVWGFIRPPQYAGRGSGTYINPDDLAGFLEMVLPLSLAYVFAGRLSHVTKVLLGYASLVSLSGIGVSLSRGGWIAAGVSLMVLFAVLVRKRGYRLPALALVAVLLGSTLLFLRKNVQVAERVSHTFWAGGPADAGLSRLALWRPAWRMWEDHLCWGIGPGHFDARFPQYRAATYQLSGQYAHNDYLNTLAEWGIVGAGLVAAAWLLLYLGVFRTWKYVQRSSAGLAQKQSNRSAFVLGASIGLLAILLHSFVDFNFQIPANAILAVALMALVSSHLRFTSERYWFSLGWLGKTLATVIGLAGVLYLGLQGERRAREYLWLLRAQRVKTAAEQTAALNQACAAEPLDYQAAWRLGEVLRRLSFQGNDDYRQQAQAAMVWFKRAMTLNPYNEAAFIGYGKCLDWLGRHTQAMGYFQQARRLDPNGWYPMAEMGWHYLQAGDYPAAKEWFERSLHYKWRWPGAPIAEQYLRILQQRMAESGGKPQAQ